MTTPHKQNRWTQRSSLKRGPSSVSTASTSVSTASASTTRSKNRAGARKTDVTPQPMLQFPSGTIEIEGRTNGWSLPLYDEFKIRGSNYLKDKKKVPSQNFLFRLRGMEVFLTDKSPQNVAQEPGMLGGQLRDIPTFVLNFRLPWGILVCCFEIPERFVPYVECAYSGRPADVEKQQLMQAMDAMTPGDRCVCRFLLGDETYKNQTLKIVPVVVKGPWVAQKAAGGKPAIVGKALPTNYIYQPAEEEGKKALYLEADLNICASAAARRILSVAKSCTQALVLDLGFVVQGNQEDELPEQMLLAFRLHNLNPNASPPFPPPAPAPEATENPRNERKQPPGVQEQQEAPPATNPETKTDETDEEETESILTSSSLSFDENNFSGPFSAPDQE